jgi:hypothetical protein
MRAIDERQLVGEQGLTADIRQRAEKQRRVVGCRKVPARRIGGLIAAMQEWQ